MFGLKYFVLSMFLKEACSTVIDLEIFAKENYEDGYIIFNIGNNFVAIPDPIKVDAQLATGKCTSLPQTKEEFSRIKVQSIKNKDCLMLFSHAYCKGPSYELPSGKGSSFPYFNQGVASFRHCHKHEQGRSNNWDDNDNQPEEDEEFTHKKISFFHNLAYDNLAWETMIRPNCLTLPSSAFNSVTSVKNAECVVLYSEPHCRGYSYVVEKDETYLEFFNDKTHSFRPCTKESILGEPRLSIELVEINEIKSENDEETTKLKPAAYTKKSYFNNNGTATIKHTFEAVFEYKKRNVTEFEQMSSTAHDVSVSAGLTVEQGFSVPGIAEASLRSTIEAGYTYSVEAEASKTKSIELTSKDAFKEGREVTVPACSIYQMRSYAKIMRNYPIKYQTKVEVTGKQGERRMSAAEVKSRLAEGLEFLENKDEFTVLARGHGMMNMDYGMKSNIHVAPTRTIPNCNK